MNFTAERLPLDCPANRDAVLPCCPRDSDNFVVAAGERYYLLTPREPRGTYTLEVRDGFVWLASLSPPGRIDVLAPGLEPHARFFVEDLPGAEDGFVR